MPLRPSLTALRRADAGSGTLRLTLAVTAGESVLFVQAQLGRADIAMSYAELANLHPASSSTISRRGAHEADVETGG
jgi:hypothetical protein